MKSGVGLDGDGMRSRQLLCRVWGTRKIESDKTPAPPTCVIATTGSDVSKLDHVPFKMQGGDERYLQEANMWKDTRLGRHRCVFCSKFPVSVKDVPDKTRKWKLREFSLDIKGPVLYLVLGSLVWILNSRAALLLIIKKELWKWHV